MENPEPDFREEILGGKAIALMYSGERLPKGYALTELRAGNYAQSPYLIEIGKMRDFGAEKFYAPKPVHSRRVTEPKIIQRDNREVYGLKFFGLNTEADGVFNLTRGDAFLIANAGCFVAVISTEEQVCVIHVSRLNLFYEPRFIENNENDVPDGFQTIIASALYSIRRVHWRSKPKIWIGFGARPESNTYPSNDQKYGDVNKRRLDFIIKYFGDGCVIDYQRGVIDLAKIIKRKFELNGIPSDQIKIADQTWMPNVGASERASGPRNLCAIIVK